LQYLIPLKSCVVNAIQAFQTTGLDLTDYVHHHLMLQRGAFAQLTATCQSCVNTTSTRWPGLSAA
jgi:hypothetical protein